MPGVPKTCRLVSKKAVFEGDVPDFCRLGTLWGGRRQKASGKGEGVRRVGTVGRRKVRDESDGGIGESVDLRISVKMPIFM